jgi:hypothetical protein
LQERRHEQKKLQKRCYNVSQREKKFSFSSLGFLGTVHADSGTDYWVEQRGDMQPLRELSINQLAPKNSKCSKTCSDRAIDSNWREIESHFYLSGDDANSAANAERFIVSCAVCSIARYLESSLNDVYWVATKDQHRKRLKVLKYFSCMLSVVEVEVVTHILEKVLIVLEWSSECSTWRKNSCTWNDRAEAVSLRFLTFRWQWWPRRSLLLQQI